MIVFGCCSMGNLFSLNHPTEICIPCREKLLSKQEFDQNDADWKQEIVNIDRKVKVLTQRRNLHMARAERLEEEAMQWQVHPDLLIDARAAYKRAEQERTIVTALQTEIETLQHRKLRILEEHTP